MRERAQRILRRFGRIRPSHAGVESPDPPALVGRPAPGATNRARRWIGGLGVAGFAFFLVKGLLWLLVPWLLAIGFLR